MGKVLLRHVGIRVDLKRNLTRFLRIFPLRFLNEQRRGIDVGFDVVVIEFRRLQVGIDRLFVAAQLMSGEAEIHPYRSDIDLLLQCAAKVLVG